MSKTGPSVFVVDSKIPEPDRDSGSLRIYNLLLVLKELSGGLTFGSQTAFQTTVWSQKLESQGVRILQGSVSEYIKRCSESYDIVILSRPSNASAFIGKLRKKWINAKIIFDTVDLHHLRLYREARVTGNAQAIRQALSYKEQEVTLTETADCTFVVSSFEQAELKKINPEADIRVVSNIHEIVPTETAFVDREDIFFIGSFYHRPNIDAVRYYANDIHPFIKTKLPGLKCFIIGEHPPPEVRSLAMSDLIVTGYVPDIVPYLENCRLSIAPLRYGAGVKGKVLLSMSYGVPVVGTPAAAEGIPETDCRGLLVADSAGEFSQAVQEVYTNAKLWEDISINGNEIIQKHFSFQAARKTLAELFKDFGFSSQ